MSAPETHSQITGEELARTFDDEAPQADLSHIAFEDWVTFAVFWVMTISVFLQFFTRYVLNDSFAWTEEIATYSLVVIVFLGASMCVRLSRHIQVDFLYRYLPVGAGRTLSTWIDILRIAFFAYAIKLVHRFITLVADEPMTTIPWPKGIFYYLVLAAFVLMLLRSVQVAVQNWRNGYSVLTRPGAFDGSGG